MNILFDFEVPIPVADSPQPPVPPQPRALAEPLGPCCKCSAVATLSSPGGSIYCENCGKCAGKRVSETALGIEVKICGRSVEQFVKHQRLGIWVCPCMKGESA